MSAEKFGPHFFKSGKIKECGCHYDEKTGKGTICKNHVPEKWKNQSEETNP